MNIEKRLNLWKEAGLLSEEQLQKILQHEQEKPSGSWVLYGVVGLGVCIVLTGVISIIAANWDAFSASAKLIAYFLSLATLGYFTFQRNDTPGVIRESLLTSFAVYVLAGIGLISQTYHLQGDGWQAIYFWLAMVFPLALLAESRLLCHIWFLAFIGATITWVTSQAPTPFPVYLTVAMPFFILAFGYGLAHRVSTHFCAAARLWSYAVLLIPFVIMANISWVEGGTLFDQSTFTSVSSLASLPWLGVLLALAAVWLRKIQVGKVQGIAIATTLCILAINIIPGFFSDVQDQRILGCVLFVLSWSGAAWIAAMLERRRLFDLCTCVIGVRFIVVYFEVFGSLAATGIGLILSGFVILGTAWLWHTYRRKIAKAIQEAL